MTLAILHAVLHNITQQNNRHEDIWNFPVAGDEKIAGDILMKIFEHNERTR